MRRKPSGHSIGTLLAFTLVVLLVLPLVALLLSAGTASLSAGLSDPLFGPALALSLRTTALALVAIVVLGTPLAWWLSRSSTRGRMLVEALVELPIVMPPAVLGVALLQAFGRDGVFSPVVGDLGGIPFTETAVVIAQVVVAAPFYVQGAANAFREVDSSMMGVARSLGSSPARAFLRVAVPAALPGLCVAASLAWARALGEFGATLLFAGNLSGETQTLPLAIYTALQADVKLAVVFSLALAGLGGFLLLLLRVLPRKVRGIQ
ncbi:MAG: molybdate ABC transporter permease subunit [Myxococcota bacterium]|nr:molybdate ABC transporter permease subunit [Myxococcota bacterium]